MSNRIMAADFSAIEARVVAWLAGEQRILDAFHRNEDVYCVAASAIYGRPITKKDNPDERFIGKVATLALGYQGGVGAFATMAKGYGLDLEPAYEPVMASASEHNIEKAERAYQERGKGSGITAKRWIAAELIKLAWREGNPAIVQLWYDLENAALAAVQEPGTQQPVGRLAYKVAGSFLWCKLPSGRLMCYPYPRLAEVETPWGATKLTVVYKSVNGVTKKWEEKKGYGGLFAENVTQAIARDLMAEAMLRVDAAGYPVVLTVHDEAVCEVPKGRGGLDTFTDLMSQVPDWADGLPLAAEAWEGPRYRK